MRYTPHGNANSHLQNFDPAATRPVLPGTREVGDVPVPTRHKNLAFTSTAPYLVSCKSWWGILAYLRLSIREALNSRVSNRASVGIRERIGIVADPCSRTSQYLTSGLELELDK
jgi:hypothetical protein